jgi:hypothetical protein
LHGISEEQCKARLPGVPQEAIDEHLDEEMERGAFIEIVMQRILLKDETSVSTSGESLPGRAKNNVEQAQRSQPQDARARQEQYGIPQHPITLRSKKGDVCCCRRVLRELAQPAPLPTLASGVATASPMPQMGHHVASADTADILTALAAADGAL